MANESFSLRIGVERIDDSVNIVHISSSLLSSQGGSSIGGAASGISSILSSSKSSTISCVIFTLGSRFWT